MKQHFLQSQAWETFQAALGHRTIRRSGDGWEYLAVVERGGGMIRLYCPYGPTVESPEALDAALVSLKAEAVRSGAAFLRLQPMGVLLEPAQAKGYGMRQIPYSQPEATRRLDLSLSYDELLLQMTPSKRNVCRNYQKKGLTYHVSRDPEDVKRLLPLLHDVAARNHIAVHDDDYILAQARALMPDHASFHFIVLGDDTLTAALVFEDETTNYYAHAGTASEHRKYSANTALVGELLQYSQAQGKQWFDLYGVAPNDDPNHPWAGVTNFKTEFGGEFVRYNPTFDLPLNKTRYTAYEMLRRLRRHLRR